MTVDSVKTLHSEITKEFQVTFLNQNE